ncbi:DoxX family protein [bacterium]|nr:DoxX family protein [bacterium]
MKLLLWILSILAALILLQTLYFKFTGQPESIYIFETVGMEPWGHYGSGIVELIAGILLLIPKFRHWGALIGIGVISGAIFFHFTSLGLEVYGDYTLFLYAMVVFVCTLTILIIERNKFKALFSKP